MGRDGYYNTDSYEKLLCDFQLLIHNIMIFNMPNSHIYKQGIKLNLLGMKAFKYFEANLNGKINKKEETIRSKMPGFFVLLEDEYLDIMYTNIKNPKKELFKIKIKDKSQGEEGSEEEDDSYLDQVNLVYSIF